MKCKLIKLKNLIIKYLKDPKLFLAFLIAWMITNGWSYAMLGFGIFLNSGCLLTKSSILLLTTSSSK